MPNSDIDRLSLCARATPASRDNKVRFSREERLSLLRLFGDRALSYSSLQPGLAYFDVPGAGYIAYLDFQHFILAPRSRRLVLGDPICPPEEREHLVSAFLCVNRPAIFLQISANVAAMLRARRLRVNHFGVETDLHLADFNLTGKNKALLRHWRNKALREGVLAFERPIDQMAWPAIEALNHDWLRGRPGKRELRLLTRPLVRDREEGVRYFWAQQGDALVGMVIFDPVQRAGETVGYYWNMVRTARHAPHGTSDVITLAAIEKFRGEGVRTLHFGLSPLTGLPQNPPADCNRLTHFALRKLHDHGDSLYGFAKNWFHKQAYAGTTQDVFVCGTGGTHLGEVLAVMKALGIV